jgi:hypothetical protein
MAKMVKRVQDMDQYSIDARSRQVMDLMLKQMLANKDKLTFREITQGLAAITRARYVQVVTASKIQPEDEHVGSTARKYTASFAANAARGGAKRPGTAPRPVPVPAAADELGIFDEDEDEQSA